MTYIPPSTKPAKPPLTPKCPHCGELFTNWPTAKIHVKRCADGPHPRRPR